MNWNNFGGDWEYSEYKRVVNSAILDGDIVVNLSTEHCSYLSDKRILDWARMDGFRAELKPLQETVVVYLKEC